MRPNSSSRLNTAGALFALLSISVMTGCGGGGGNGNGNGGAGRNSINPGGAILDMMYIPGTNQLAVAIVSPNSRAASPLNGRTGTAGAVAGSRVPAASVTVNFYDGSSFQSVSSLQPQLSSQNFSMGVTSKYMIFTGLDSTGNGKAAIYDIPTRSLLNSVPLNSHPFGLVVDDAKALAFILGTTVGSSSGSSISTIDLAGGSVKYTFPVATTLNSNPWFDYNHNLVYAASVSSQQILGIDYTTGNVKATIPNVSASQLFGYPRSNIFVAGSTSGNSAYVINTVLNTADGPVSLPSPGRFTISTFSSSGGTSFGNSVLYSPVTGAGSISLFDMRMKQQTPLYTGSHTNTGLAVFVPQAGASDPTSGKLLTAATDGMIYSQAVGGIPAVRQPGIKLSLGGHIGALRYNLASNQIAVPVPSKSQVYLFDGTTLKQTAIIPTAGPAIELGMLNDMLGVTEASPSNPTSGMFEVFDTSSAQRTGIVQNLVGPTGVTSYQNITDPTASVFYVLTDNQQIIRGFNPTTAIQTSVQTIPFTGTAPSIVYDPLSGAFFMASPALNNADFLTTAGNLTSVPNIQAASWVSIVPGGGTCFVGSLTNNSVTVLDSVKHTVLSTIGVEAPGDLAFAGNLAVVTDTKNGNIIPFTLTPPYSLGTPVPVPGGTTGRIIYNPIRQSFEVTDEDEAILEFLSLPL